MLLVDRSHTAISEGMKGAVIDLQPESNAEIQKLWFKQVGLSQVINDMGETAPDSFIEKLGAVTAQIKNITESYIKVTYGMEPASWSYDFDNAKLNVTF